MQRDIALAGAILLAGLLGTSPAGAIDAGVRQGSDACQEPMLEVYEPITFGYTKQGDDVPFVDFTISVKAQLLRNLLCHHFNGKSRIYLTFTGRFGFYFGTRHSSPVIARDYNPKFVWRLVPGSGPGTSTTQQTSEQDKQDKQIEEYSEYLDFAYAHDSNGQSIDTLEEFQIETAQLGDSHYALDYVSRGWDYLEVAGKKSFHDGALRVYPDLKFFLRHGFLQGVPEEYYSWEVDSTLRPRHAFDGVGVTLDYLPFKPTRLKSGLRLSLKYTTGYEPVARFNTVRGELGFDLWGVPLTVWMQDGYLNSLARYYRKTTSGGIEFRLVEF